MSREAYDIIIVGAGAAGCVVTSGPGILSDAEIGEWMTRAVTTMFHPVGANGPGCAGGG